MVEIGPHKHGDMPMKIMYRALDKLMIEPEVLYVAATSGTAAKMVVDETGDRKPHKDRMAVMAYLRRGENRVYCSGLPS